MSEAEERADVFRQSLRRERVIDTGVALLVGGLLAFTVPTLLTGAWSAVAVLAWALLFLAGRKLAAEHQRSVEGDLRLQGGGRIKLATYSRAILLGALSATWSGIGALIVMGGLGLSALVDTVDPQWIVGLAAAAVVLTLTLLLCRIRYAIHRLMRAQACIDAGDVQGAQAVLDGGLPTPTAIERWRSGLLATIAVATGDPQRAEALFASRWSGTLGPDAVPLAHLQSERGDTTLASSFAEWDDADSIPWHAYLSDAVAAHLAIVRFESSPALRSRLQAHLPSLTTSEARGAKLLLAALCQIDGDGEEARTLLAGRLETLGPHPASEPHLAALVADAEVGRASTPRSVPVAAASVRPPAPVLADPFSVGEADTPAPYNFWGASRRGVIPVDFVGAIPRRPRLLTVLLVLVDALILPLSALVVLAGLGGGARSAELLSVGLMALGLGAGIGFALLSEQWAMRGERGPMVLGDGVGLRKLSDHAWVRWQRVRNLALLVPACGFVLFALALSGGVIAMPVGLVLWVFVLLVARAAGRTGRYLVLCRQSQDGNPAQALASADALADASLLLRGGVRCWRGLALLQLGRAEEAEEAIGTVGEQLPEASYLRALTQVGRKPVHLAPLLRGGWPDELGARVRRHLLVLVVAATTGETVKTERALEDARELPNRWGDWLVALAALVRWGADPEEAVKLLRLRRRGADRLPELATAWPHLAPKIELLKAALGE